MWGDEKNNFRMTCEPYGWWRVYAVNFPISMVTSGMLPALIAGNTVVVKPSRNIQPLSQKRVVELMQETRIPGGVVNCVIGDRGRGAILLQQKLIWCGLPEALGRDNRYLR